MRYTNNTTNGVATLHREMADGREVEIEAAWTAWGGSPRSFHGPGENPEVEIYEVTGPDGVDLTLSGGEEEEVIEAALEEFRAQTRSL